MIGGEYETHVGNRHVAYGCILMAFFERDFLTSNVDLRRELVW